jgi:hypothetical protein
LGKEDTMKINFTKKEYRTLLEIFEIAHWVLHAHKTREYPNTAKYRKLEQKIFSCAKDMGFEDLIMFDTELERYYPTAEFEETSPAMKFITEFENDTFWEELIERLVQRDLIRQEGKEGIVNMSIEERFQKEEPLEEKYSTEFETYGLDRISICQDVNKSGD